MSDRTPRTDAATDFTMLRNCSRKIERELKRINEELDLKWPQARAWRNVCECCRDLGYEGPKAGEHQIMGICRFIREAVEKGKQS
jgi:hypothetical protein